MAVKKEKMLFCTVTRVWLTNLPHWCSQKMPERARENRYRRSICRSRLLQGCARVKVRRVKHSLQVRGIVALLTTTRSSTDGHRVRQIEASSFGVSTSPSTAVERVTSMWRHWPFPRSAELGPSRKLRVIRGKQRQASVEWLRTNSSLPTSTTIFNRRLQPRPRFPVTHTSTATSPWTDPQVH